MFRIVFAYVMVSWACMTLHAHVELKYPEGGEIYHPGETMNIAWVETISHTTYNWDLFYSVDGGLTWIILKEDIAIEARNHQWIVPDVSTVNARIKVIQDNEGGAYVSSSPKFTIAPVTSTQRSVQHSEIRIFPNPIIDFATIEFDNPNNDQFSLTIINSRGGVVRFIPHISTGKINIYRETLPAGSYFIQLSDERLIRGRGKLVIL